MKAHLIGTHLLVPRSRSSAKVKYQDQISQNLTKKLNISLLLQNEFSYKPHIWNEELIHICWYRCQDHLPRSRSNIKVTFLKRWPFWGISVLQTHLVSLFSLLEKISVQDWMSPVAPWVWRKFQACVSHTGVVISMKIQD